ncbi:MAG: hypothetical protein D6781_09265 [Verrucomicrobia bacterium]|nr:MAG: hypothetical protein D6781_09265 [Verrucomicrobiota bacterium]
MWWRWVAPGDGRAAIAIENAAFMPIISAYREVRDGELTYAMRPVRPNFDGPAAFAAEAGVAYWVQVATTDPVGSDFVLHLRLEEGPRNDLFDRAITLSGDHLWIDGSNAGATSEYADPVIEGEPAERTVWWRWTPQKDGAARVSVQGLGRRVHLFTGDLPASLRSLSGSGWVQVKAGVPLSIMVYSWRGDTGGPFVLRLDRYDPPANDRFADRFEVSGSSVVTTGEVLGAWYEPGEPEHGSFGRGPSVWWKWTAPGDLFVEVSARSDDGRAQTVAVYEGERVTDLVRITDNASYAETAVFQARAGREYAIAVVPRFNVERVTVELDAVPVPENDALAGAFPLTGELAAVRGTTLGAASELGEAPHGNGDTPATASTWFAWEAPASGRTVVQVRSRAFLPIVAVYRGSAMARLDKVAYAPETRSASGVATLAFDAVAGTVYRIAVETRNGGRGDFDLLVTQTAEPPNDDFADSTVIPAAGGVVRGSNFGATREVGERADHLGTADSSIWWQWIPEQTGFYEFSVAGSAFDAEFAVYRGQSLPELTPLFSNHPRGGSVMSDTLPAFVVAGEPLQIAVSSAGEVGEVQLSIRPYSLGGPDAVGGMSVKAGDPLLLTAPIWRSVRIAAFQWLHDGVAIPGANEASFLLPSAQVFQSGEYSLRVSGDFGTAEIDPVRVTVTPAGKSGARLLNLSTRAVCLRGDQILLPGFVLQGEGRQRVLVRAIGPSLESFGVSGFNEDPSFHLLRRDAVSGDWVEVGANDNWNEGPEDPALAEAFARVGAFELPDGSRDAAGVFELEAGEYSLQARGVGGNTGVTLVEVFEDVRLSGDVRLVNLSIRARVDVGNDVLIPGMVTSAEGAKTVLIRAAGPALGALKVEGYLEDPAVKVYRKMEDGTDRLVAENDDWDEPDATAVEAAFYSVGAFPFQHGSGDAALLLTLGPGPYTIHVSGAGEGIALVEVYEVP